MHQAKCPHCGTTLDNDGSLTGQEVVCPECSGIFRVSEAPTSSNRPDRVAAEASIGPPTAAERPGSEPAPPPQAADGPKRPGPGPQAPPLCQRDPFPKIDTEAAPRPASAQAGHAEEPHDGRGLMYGLLGLAVFLAALIGAVLGGRYVRERMAAGPGGEKTLQQWIDRLAKGPDKAARREAAESILAQGPAAMVQALDATTDTPDEGNSVSFTPPAVQAIAELGPSAVGALAEALGSQKLDVRVAAAYILREMGPESKGAVDALVRAAADPNARVRRYAIDALGNAGADAATAVDALIPLVDNKDRITRHRAIVALGRIGPKAEAAVPALAKVQDNARDRSLREAAEAALHQINLDSIAAASMSQASDEVKELVKQLGDADEHESVHAAKALGRMGRDAAEAAPLLAKALDAKNKWVREAAADALGAMGQDARPFIPALEKAAKDPEEEVRQGATRALDKIRPR